MNTELHKLPEFNNSIVKNIDQLIRFFYLRKLRDRRQHSRELKKLRDLGQRSSAIQFSQEPIESLQEPIESVKEINISDKDHKGYVEFSEEFLPIHVNYNLKLEKNFLNTPANPELQEDAILGLNNSIFNKKKPDLKTLINQNIIDFLSTIDGILSASGTIEDSQFKIITEKLSSVLDFLKFKTDSPQFTIIQEKLSLMQESLNYTLKKSDAKNLKDSTLQTNTPCNSELMPRQNHSSNPFVSLLLRMWRIICAVCAWVCMRSPAALKTVELNHVHTIKNSEKAEDPKKTILDTLETIQKQLEKLKKLEEFETLEELKNPPIESNRIIQEKPSSKPNNSGVLFPNVGNQSIKQTSSLEQSPLSVYSGNFSSFKSSKMT